MRTCAHAYAHAHVHAYAHVVALWQERDCSALLTQLAQRQRGSSRAMACSVAALGEAYGAMFASGAKISHDASAELSFLTSVAAQPDPNSNPTPCGAHARACMHARTRR